MTPRRASRQEGCPTIEPVPGFLADDTATDHARHHGRRYRSGVMMARRTGNPRIGRHLNKRKREVQAAIEAEERRLSEPGICIIGDDVIWDGQAVTLGAAAADPHSPEILIPELA